MFVVRSKRNNKFSMILSVCSVETIITLLKTVFSPPEVYFQGLFGGKAVPVCDSHFQNKSCHPSFIDLFPPKSFHLELPLLKACFSVFYGVKHERKGKNVRKGNQCLEFYKTADSLSLHSLLLCISTQ